MKTLLLLIGLTVVGGCLGYDAGREYCAYQLNWGQIYDEAPSIPADISDGSAYGKSGATRGAGISFLLGLGFVVWWRRRELSREIDRESPIQ